MKYSVVIPVYNSDQSLIELVKRLDVVLIEDYEIIFVDDGSVNLRTKAVLEALVSEKVKVCYHVNNQGKPYAQLTGFREAKGEYVINMDDDLEHSPEELKSLLAVKEQFDIVSALLTNKERGMWRQLVSWLRKAIESTLLSSNISPFRVIKKSVVERVLEGDLEDPYIPKLLIQHSESIGFVQVERSERVFGKSSFSFFKLIRAFLNLLKQERTR